jgi:hypothetical protein
LPNLPSSASSACWNFASAARSGSCAAPKSDSVCPRASLNPRRRRRSAAAAARAGSASSSARAARRSRRRRRSARRASCGACAWRTCRRAA